MKSLNKELAINQEYINQRIMNLTSVERKGKQLLKLTGPSSTDISIDSLSVLLLNLIYQRPYTPIIAQYQHVISSDDNNLIKSDSLKQLLLEYQAELDVSSFQQFEMRENIIQYLQENYSPLHMLKPTLCIRASS